MGVKWLQEKKKWQHKEMVFWVVIFIKQVILSHGVKRTCIIWHWLTSIHLALPQENPLMKLRRKPQGKNNPGCCSGCLFPRFYFQWYLWMGKLPGIVNRHGNRNIVIPKHRQWDESCVFPFFTLTHSQTHPTLCSFSTFKQRRSREENWSWLQPSIKSKNTFMGIWKY